MNAFLASLMFFTRLPFWRIMRIPTQQFKHVVAYWSVVGWLTGGLMAGTYCIASMYFPLTVSLVLALLVRILLTGALHEDGLADFFDGFGGGANREQILQIMKDSRIGGYGVLGLIFYYMLAFTLLTSLPHSLIPYVLFVGDVFPKFVCSFLIVLLPYARKEEESKAKVVYERLSVGEIVISAIGGVVPLFFFPTHYLPAIICPVVLFFYLWYRMKSRLGGYTGDCCGAAFLLCEIAFWLGCVGMLNIIY